MLSRFHLPVRILLALVLFVLPARAADRDSVTWMEAAFPPFFIQSGPFSGLGYGDVVSAILRERLTGYDHQQITTNITRHFYKFRQGEKVCSVGLYRTPEREAFMHFSIPSFLTLPAVLIVRKERHAEFGGRASVRLAAVLAQQRWTIGLARDRSYGPATDRILQRHAGDRHLLTSPGQELSRNLFRMLMLDRLDGLIGLPEENLYQAEQLGIRDQLMTLTIDENQQGYDGWLSSVGCSKNEWGRRIIAEIDRILLTERATERYRRAYERWLDPNSIRVYRRVYREVFLPGGPARPGRPQPAPAKKNSTGPRRGPYNMARHRPAQSGRTVGTRAAAAQSGVPRQFPLHPGGRSWAAKNGRNIMSTGRIPLPSNVRPAVGPAFFRPSGCAGSSMPPGSAAPAAGTLPWRSSSAATFAGKPRSPARSGP